MTGNKPRAGPAAPFFRWVGGFFILNPIIVLWMLANGTFAERDRSLALTLLGLEMLLAVGAAAFLANIWWRARCALTARPSEVSPKRKRSGMAKKDKLIPLVCAIICGMIGIGGFVMSASPAGQEVPRAYFVLDGLIHAGLAVIFAALALLFSLFGGKGGMR